MPLRRRRRGTEGGHEGARARTRRIVPALHDAGWALPASLAEGRLPVATRLGVRDSPWTAAVDGRGAVSPTPGWFTLDWAVGADDRWYVPAREAGVEQVRVDHAPVVETRLRVPGGHVVHRAYGVRGPRFAGDDEWIVVEVENATSVPVAIAWLIRPWTPDAVGTVPSIDLRPAEGAAGSGPWHLWAGELAAVLPRRPSRWAAGVGDDGGADPLAAVLSGDALAEWDGVQRLWPAGAADGVAASGTWSALGGDRVEVTSDDGLASLALLVPVPHTATTSIVLPRGVAADEPVTATSVGWPAERANAEAIARGWTNLAERGPRVELPDPVLADAVAGARRSVALCHRVTRVATDDDRRAVPLVHSVEPTGGWGGGAGGAGAVGEQMEVLAALAWWGEHDTVDQALFGWPDGQQRGGGFGSEAATAAALRALAAHAVAAGDAGPARAWLPELGGAVEWLGRRVRRLPPDADPRVVADGLDAGALLLGALDQPEAAARIAVDAAAARAAAPPAPVGPTLDLDGPAVAPRAVGAAAVAATRAGGDASAIWALLRRASATWTWPDPERWVGDDGLAQTRLLAAVARLLVDDRADGLALTTWMPPAWWGLGWEVHGAPTRWGRVSYAVRWHSGRPALLWELGEPLPGVTGDPVVRVPGLDASWSSTERRGEALLTAVPPPEEADAGPEVATGGVAVAAPPRSVWRPQDPGPDAPDGADGGQASGPAAPDRSDDTAAGPPDEGTSFT